MTQTDETPAVQAVRGSEGYRSNERDAPEHSGDQPVAQGDVVADRQLDVPAEIDTHDVILHSVIHSFVASPRFRREIEGALRSGPRAVWALLDEVAFEQDLVDAAAMIQGVVDFPITDPSVLRQTLGGAITLIERVKKGFEDGLLQRRRS
jgi:hypothetical protein